MGLLDESASDTDYVASLPELAQRFGLARLAARYDLTEARRTRHWPTCGPERR